ncbi:hypothetical protein NLI96_g11058 [Meripilus lineatus]|uniref:Cytochrome P450 n=1 Tax=Meripilus lineatus TaxID=2056292 RepID=A0AAD5UWQ6_9APHY|nr:hypothetical protein NLI96_g11058 [Physisporinus lineatus]
MPTLLPAKWPGGLDLAAQVKKAVETRFPATLFFEFAELYGHTFNFRLMGENRVFTAEPEYIKTILATDFPGYEKGKRNDDLTFQIPHSITFRTLLPFSDAGPFGYRGFQLGRFHRGMTRPFFSRDRISHFDIFDRHAEDALNQVRLRMKEGYPIDWQDLVSRFTLDSATEFLFGKDVKSLAAGLPYPPSSDRVRSESDSSNPANAFAEAFLEAQNLSATRGRYSSAWALLEILGDKVAVQMKTIDNFIQPILQSALEKKAQKKAQGELPTNGKDVADDETLLGHLVNLTDDRQILRDETLNILLAGRDTTAATLTFAIYKLTQHPDIVRRLREEILMKVGSHRRPTYEDIREMKYLRAFINEVLRLYPPVPFNVRFATKDTLWPTKPGEPPYFIPAGTKCLYSVFVMHRRKDLWGPDAADFDPDRFIDDRLQKYLTPNPFIFLPFNAGPRICLGQQFAYNEASFMLIRLLQQFSSFELVQDANPECIPPPGWAKSKGSDGKDKAWIKAHLTIYAKGGLWVKMGDAATTESV